MDAEDSAMDTGDSAMDNEDSAMDTEDTNQHCRLQQPVLLCHWINAIIRKTDKAPRSLNLYTRWRLVFSFTPRPTLPTTKSHCIYIVWHWQTLGHKLSLLVWTKKEQICGGGGTAPAILNIPTGHLYISADLSKGHTPREKVRWASSRSGRFREHKNHFAPLATAVRTASPQPDRHTNWAVWLGRHCQQQQAVTDACQIHKRSIVHQLRFKWIKTVSSCREIRYVMAPHLDFNEGKIRVLDKIALTCSHVFGGRPYCRRPTCTVDNINMSELPVIITPYCRFLQTNSVWNTCGSLMAAVTL